jgi:hypothetical protein
LDRRKLTTVCLLEPPGQVGYLAAQGLELGNQGGGRGGRFNLLGSRVHRVEQRLIIGFELVVSLDERLALITVLIQ